MSTRPDDKRPVLEGSSSAISSRDEEVNEEIGCKEEDNNNSNNNDSKDKVDDSSGQTNDVESSFKVPGLTTSTDSTGTILKFGSSSSLQPIALWDTHIFGNSSNMALATTWTCPAAGL